MKEENRAKRRDHILDIAVEVLAERGYRDANMRVVLWVALLWVVWWLVKRLSGAGVR